MEGFSEEKKEEKNHSCLRAPQAGINQSF